MSCPNYSLKNGQEEAGWDILEVLSQDNPEKTSQTDLVIELTSLGLNLNGGNAFIPQETHRSSWIIILEELFTWGSTFRVHATQEKDDARIANSSHSRRIDIVDLGDVKFNVTSTKYANAHSRVRRQHQDKAYQCSTIELFFLVYIQCVLVEAVVPSWW